MSKALTGICKYCGKSITSTRKSNFCNKLEYARYKRIYLWYKRKGVEIDCLSKDLIRAYKERNLYLASGFADVMPMSEWIKNLHAEGYGPYQIQSVTRLSEEEIGSILYGYDLST